MFTQPASHNRFNLLLLSEGEHYFSDYSAIFYPNAPTDVEAVSKCVCGIGALFWASMEENPTVTLFFGVN